MNVQTNADVRIVLSLVEERQARLRRTSLLVGERHETRRTLRRWVGRRLVALGSRLANERTMRPARAR
jgi:hypothetical protein